ncbi:MAG: TonB-dependent receptor plug domain-containing protein, partial [Amphiplicatus sp.]
MCAAATAVAASSAALAQEEAVSDEVLVTATKRAQTIQDVPFSVNAQTQDDIQRTGSQSLEDVSRNVAGLAIQNLGPGQTQVGIRGVSAGQIVRDQPGVKEQVGIYLDESVISLSLFTPDLDLFDLNRVETLRGPQGTLFGSGSIGGTLRYITNQPKLGEYEGMAEAGVSAIDGGGVGWHAKGMVNLPMGDTAALRIVGFHTDYAGFIDAQLESGGVKKDINDGERFGGRVSLLWEPIPELSITPRFVYQNVRTDGFNRREVFNM